MNSSRRVFVIAIGAGSLGFLHGCTKMLWEQRQPATITYTETVSSVLISADNKHLVAIGEKYHYVFDAPPVLVAALRASFHRSLSAELGVFDVGMFGATSGTFALLLDASASEQEHREAIAAGFQKSPDGTIRFAGELKGKRYASPSAPPEAALTHLNRTYTVSVREDASAAAGVDTVARAALTPVTFTVDVVAQAVFWYIVVPVGIVALLVATPFMKEPRTRESDQEQSK